MRFCLMIEGQEDVTWEEWIRLAGLAERLGFEALYRSDHYLSMFEPVRRSSLDAWTTIAALSSLTTRLRFGTLVSPVGFRHPSHLAKVVSTADHISNGRIEVGIGAGWYTAEHTSFGFTFPDDQERISVLGEYLEVVNRLWTEDRVTFHGRHFELEHAYAEPKPVQSPHPPVIMGGLARPRAAALAARWANEYNLFETSPEQAAAKRGLLDQACERTGRDPSTLGLSINANILIGSDRHDLERRAMRHLDYQALDIDPKTHLEGMGPDRLVGTPEQIVDQIDAYARAGVTRVMFQVFPHDDYDAIELIGNHIVTPHGKV